MVKSFFILHCLQINSVQKVNLAKIKLVTAWKLLKKKLLNINKRTSESTTGLDLLAVQNKLLVNNPAVRSLPKVYRYTLNPAQLQSECQYFQRITDAKLHVPSTQATYGGFADACSLLERCAREGNFPKDIKHVIVGHGTGSSINGDWQIINGGGYVFNYINRNIPRGEKVLVLCCEGKLSPRLRGRCGVGDEVVLGLHDRFHPAKIVESGKNEIVGDLYFSKLIDEDSTVPFITNYNVPKLNIKHN